MLKRTEAIALLKEISRRCGDHIVIDSVSITPHKKQSRHSSEKTEPRYKLYLQTPLDFLSECGISSLLKEKGLEIVNSGNFVIIYRNQ